MTFIILVIGLAGLVWCLLPFFSYGVLNIGNVTGIIVFLLILVYGLLRRKINELIQSYWKKKSGKIFLSVCLFIAAITVFFVVLETICMFGTIKNGPKGDETVVVLGSYVSKSGPSIMLKCRLNKAYEYLEENPDLICIVSGGQGKDEPCAEAIAMKRYLVEKGISEERIIEESNSANTRENLLFSKEIIEKNGYNDKVTIISNEFHLYRAGRIADRVGLEHNYLSAPSPATMFSSYYIRELYAILADWFIYS